jgi:hypothetical protein
MVRIVLLAVGAAWAAVIIPPLLRSRVDNRPNSSINDFRRQLSTLQRTVPTRHVAPMRSMGRPLAPAPQRSHSTSIQRPRQGQQIATQRSHAGHQTGHQQHGHQQHGHQQHGHHTAPMERRPEQRSHQPHRKVQMHRVSQRELVRRRRANVLFVLGVSTAATLFLAATTKSQVMLYVFALAFVSLCFYCYRLAQLRSLEQGHGYDTWFNAA